MNQFGIIQAAVAIPFHSPAGIRKNADTIIRMILEADEKGVSILVFPELSLTGYTCNDLFHHQAVQEEAITALFRVAAATAGAHTLSIVGLPVGIQNKLYNCAAVIHRGKILGIVPKMYVPGYREFYEPRWFATGATMNENVIRLKEELIPFGHNLIFQEETHPEFSVGVEVCEDLWVPVPPSSLLAEAGATVICNLSASNALVAKSEYRRTLILSQSGRCASAYLYCSAGPGESTTDVVFDADGVIAENGVIRAESRRFLRENQTVIADIDLEKLSLERRRQNTFPNSKSEYRKILFKSGEAAPKLINPVDPHPFVPKDPLKLTQRCEEIFQIQTAGLAKRLESIPGVRPVIGISGGLDSTLALLVIDTTCRMLGMKPESIVGVTMPGFGTTNQTYQNAVKLSKALGITLIKQPIRQISSLMMKTIQLPDNQHDITYENIQARARTYLLMTYANQYNGIVIGTGDLSESALGWCTYNADHISMYNVNSGIPKTLVQFMIDRVSVTHFNEKIRKILLSIIDQPISPELLPSDGKTFTQKTEEKIGPYELHDFFLFYFVRYGFSAEKILFLAENAFQGTYNKETIKKWLSVFISRFFTNQWKRDCVPAGIKVGSIDLSPRGSWRMPADADFSLFKLE